MHFETVAIWGMGLLGGSLGLALREQRLAGRIIGIGRNMERLQRARELLTCNEVTTDPAEGLAQADLVVLCTPVTVLADSLPEFAKHFKPGAIVTDVGSTKRRIVDVADACIGDAARFVGSHPMSGAEVSGVEHARADLYVGNPCFLTPTPRTDLAAVAALSSFWRGVGSRVVITDPERHDRLVGVVSHVPHLAAAALALLAADQREDENFLASIAGNGFWSMTRLAKGDLTMWTEICAENRNEIATQLDALIERLGRMRDSLEVSGCQEPLEAARSFMLELDQLRPQRPSRGGE